MTDIFGNILTQMSSAFNNQNKKENLDIQLNKDKTLKWRGLHNNQFAASKKRGGTATKPSSSPTPSTKISNGGGTSSTTTADGTLCEGVPSGCNAEVEGGSGGGEIKNDELKIDETKQPSTVANQSDSIIVNTDNTIDNSPTNSNNNTSIDNDLIKKENILKYRTRNQRQRRQTIAEPDNVIASSLYRVDNTEPSINSTSESQQTTPPLKSTKKRKIISDTDETQTPNKIQLRGRKTDETANVSSSIAQTSVIDSVEETAKNPVSTALKIDQMLIDYTTEDASNEISKEHIIDIPVAEQPTVKPKLKRGRKKKIILRDIAEEKPIETNKEFDKQIMQSFAKIPKKRGRKPKTESTVNAAVSTQSSIEQQSLSPSFDFAVVEKTPTKKSSRASTKENGNNGGILATAIARKEKIYEQILPQQRLSRRIKPTAKILANEELRFGFELQNNARLSLSSDNLEEGTHSEEKKDDINILPSLPPTHHQLVQVPNVMRYLGMKTPPSSPPPRISSISATAKIKEKPLQKVQTVIRKPCPDPEAFLNDIKQNKIALNRSPEDKIKKLNKKQQRRLFKLKEKHLAKLGLKKISNVFDDFDSDEVSDDNDEFIPKQKISVPQKSGVTLRIRNASLSGKSEDELRIARKDRRISLDRVTKSLSKPPLNHHNNITELSLENTNQTESSHTNQHPVVPIKAKSNGTKKLCLCETKSQYYVRKSQEVMQCVAIDQIENHTVGCSNEIKRDLVNLVRPSARVSYMILCESHRKRLQAHNCCAGCGIYCTQGFYAMCEQNHLFHRDCATKFILNTPFNANFMGADDDNFTRPTLALKCPHCGANILNEDFKVVIKCRESSVFLPFNLKRAKMVFPAENLKNITNPLAGSREKTLIDIEKLIPEPVFKTILNAEANTSNTSVNFTHKDLFYAIHDDNPKRVAEIIASGFDITTSFREFHNGTCLHLVASLGTATIAYLILSKTPSQYYLDLMDNELRTSLMCAVAAEKHEIINILIQCGADVSIKGTDGMTALHIAARRGDLKSTKILLDYYRQNKNTIKFKAFLDSVDDGHWTALVWAAENGHSDIVSYLISLGADSTICDTENNVALHWAALSDSVETVVPLLQSNCINSQNVKGDTPLHISCRQQNTQICLIFLAHGADLNINNEFHETPYESIANENSPCARALRFNINIRNLIKPPKWKIAMQDISNGREYYPIQILSNLNATHLEDELDMPDFKYITKTILLQNELQIDHRISQMRICTCSDDCSSEDCQCSLISLQNWYSTDGRLKDDFNFEDPAMIFECNDVCGCNKLLCNNRVVQKGIKCRLQVFDSGDKIKGWGVRTLAKIVKGSFIAEYTGEILTDTEADRRTDDSYFFDLGSLDHCIDANFYGNVSRFFNHSCDPNIVPVRVYYEHQDLRFPKIAFFASRDIAAGEEITFDYGEKFWIVKFKNFTCHCNVDECKYSKITITKTLNDYNQRNPSSLC